MNQYALAVDLGATNVLVALVSSRGHIIQKIKKQTPKRGRDARVISDAIADMITYLITAYPRINPAGIGISSMGPLDYKRGGPSQSPNIPFAFVPLVQPLQKKFSLPTLLYNDANAAVRGEQYFGAGKHKKNLVYVTISTGIGGGVIVDNNLLLGKSGNAAEIGHMTVDTAHNLACTCKKGMGHWEGYGSGRNIPRFFLAWMRAQHKSRPFHEILDPAEKHDTNRTLTSHQKHRTLKELDKAYEGIHEAKDIFDRAQTGDRIALRFLDELHRINARAVSNIIVNYDPELITIGGSVMLENAPILLAGIKKYLDRYLPIPDIRVTPLGHDIGLLGAATAVFQHK